MPPRERLREPALLVVDMQNDFVRVGAPLEVPDARATIAPIRRLLGAFRAAACRSFLPAFSPDETPHLMWLWSPQCWPDTRCCWQGSQAQLCRRRGPARLREVIDELAPLARRARHRQVRLWRLSRHRSRLAACAASALRSLLVTGTVTQICVEETAREAFHYGYRTTVVADAVSSYAPDLHAATLKNFAMKFGWVADTNTALSWL